MVALYLREFPEGWHAMQARECLARIEKRKDRAETVPLACCVAVLGSANREASVRRIATGTGRGTVAARSGSVSPRRLHLESLHPYLGAEPFGWFIQFGVEENLVKHNKSETKARVAGL